MDNNNGQTQLNLGCGTKKLQGYINIDILKEVQPDIIRDLGKEKLPFVDDSIDHVYSNHFLEHLTQDETINLLEELYRVCKNGSKIVFVAPHYLSPVACQLGHKQKVSENIFDAYTYGKQTDKQYFIVDYFVSLQRYRPKNKLFFPFLMIIPCNIYFTLKVKKDVEKKKKFRF